MKDRDERLSDVTPLQLAAQKNDLSYFYDEKQMLTKEDLSATFMGNTALIWGVCNSSIGFVLELLVRSQKVACDHVNIKSTLMSYLNTPLIISVSKGWAHKDKKEPNNAASLTQSDIAKALLKAGAHVNAVDAHGKSALHYACLHRNYEAIETLMQANADYTLKDVDGFTPIDYCCTPYSFAEKMLDDATGGSKEYTFTLESENFDNNTDFYSLLSTLLEKNSIHCAPKLLKELDEYNQKSQQQMNKLTADIHQCAKALYVVSNPKVDWSIYEHEVVASIGVHSDITQTSIMSIHKKAAKKIRDILTLCIALEKESTAKISINDDKVAQISYPSWRMIELIDAQLNNIDLFLSTSFTFFKNMDVESLLLNKLRDDIAIQYQLPLGDPQHVRLGI